MINILYCISYKVVHWQQKYLIFNWEVYWKVENSQFYLQTNEIHILHFSARKHDVTEQSLSTQADILWSR